MNLPVCKSVLHINGRLHSSNGSYDLFLKYKFSIFREDTTSAFTGFHERPPSFGIWSIGFFRGKKIREPGEKPSEQGENQQTQPTYEAKSRIGIWATSVGGENSY